jgi:hypothetical protein
MEHQVREEEGSRTVDEASQEARQSEAAEAGHKVKRFEPPKGVHVKHGSYYVVRNNKWIRLTRVSEGAAALYTKLEELQCGSEGTVAHAILAYVKDGMDELAVETQQTYRSMSRRMLNIWGHLRLNEINRSHVRQFLRWCRRKKRGTLGNREKAFMSSVYTYAQDESLTSHNPFLGVKRNKERPSRTYIKHEQLVTELDRAPPHLQPLLALAYLWGMRQTDLRLLTRDAIREKRLHLQESKTKKEHRYQITDVVATFLELALEHREQVAQRFEKAAATLNANSQFERAEGKLKRAQEVRSQQHLLLSAVGRPWTATALHRALRRFKLPFKFRDIRAKPQTDRQEIDILGHSGQMRDVYIRIRELRAVK